MLSVHQRGSTLILALLIVSVVSSMAFAAGQLFVSEARIAGTLEDTNTAYYAAESGIDKGISEFRRDRNKQICQGGGNCTVTSSAQPQTPFSNGANYDIKMWYLGPYVGDGTKAAPTNVFNENDLNLPSDGGMLLKNNGSKLFDISKVTIVNGDIDFYFKLADPDSAIPNPIIELRLIHNNGYITKLLDGWRSGCNCQPTVGSITLLDRLIPGEDIILARKIIDKNREGVAQSDITSIQVKVFGGDLKVGMQANKATPASPNVFIDTGETTIESVGIFGRVKRKLQAKIDRTSGTLIGIFDFTLFSQTGIQ